MLGDASSLLGVAGKDIIIMKRTESCPLRCQASLTRSIQQGGGVTQRANEKKKEREKQLQVQGVGRASQS